MRVHIVTRVSEVSQPITWLATELRSQGVTVDLVVEGALDRASTKDVVIWEYPGGSIEPSTLEDGDEYAMAFAAVIAPIDPGRVFLFNSPRNRDSLIVPSRLALAGSLDKYDAWVAYTPDMLGKQTWYQSGIVGRADLLTALGCVPEHNEGYYAKVRVAPFPSLIELLVAYLQRYVGSYAE